MRDFEKNFLNASAERERSARRRKRLAFAFGFAMTFLLVAMTVLFLVARDNRFKAQRMLVEQDLRRGLDLCQQGKTTLGVHWLVRGLAQSEQVMNRDDPVNRLIRYEISAWSAEIRRSRPPFSHDKPISVAMFSPDGDRVLTGSVDGTALLWDVKTDRPRTVRLNNQTGDVVALAFSKDGKTVLTGSRDGIARLWDLTTDGPQSVELPHKGAVVAVAISKDGKTALTGSWDSTAGLWDLTKRPPRAVVLKHDGAVTSVAFSPDGKYALTGSWDNSCGSGML